MVVVVVMMVMVMVMMVMMNDGGDDDGGDGDDDDDGDFDVKRIVLTGLDGSQLQEQESVWLFLDVFRASGWLTCCCVLRQRSLHCPLSSLELWEGGEVVLPRPAVPQPALHAAPSGCANCSPVLRGVA